jgi:hypothetical protein
VAEVAESFVSRDVASWRDVRVSALCNTPHVLSRSCSGPSLTVLVVALHTSGMLPHVDVVIVFRAFNKSLSKKQAIECAQRAEVQYTRLLKTLDAAGLRAVGRKGEKQGHLLVLVSCPLTQLASLIRTERYVPRSALTAFLTNAKDARTSSTGYHFRKLQVPSIRITYRLGIDYVSCMTM